MSSCEETHMRFHSGENYLFIFICHYFAKRFSQSKPKDSHRSSHWRERAFQDHLEIKCNCVTSLPKEAILKITNIFTLEEGLLNCDQQKSWHGGNEGLKKQE